MTRKPATPKTVETLKHDEAKRKNIPTAEHQSVIDQENASPRTARYARNVDLDPQLVWRGKDEQDWSDLVVNAPPLYIQEKVHPKVLIDDLLRQTREANAQASSPVTWASGSSSNPSRGNPWAWTYGGGPAPCGSITVLPIRFAYRPTACSDLS
jgi:hypothetical protein